MALVLIETAGATNANTYASLIEAEAYFETRLHKTAWTSSIAGTKNIALAWATSLLDELVAWVGHQSTETQALRWPRELVWDIEGYKLSPTTIPTFLKNATAEYALHLIGSDLTLGTNTDLMGFEFMKVGPIEIKVDKYTKKPILPQSVQTIIRQYSQAVKTPKTLVRM